MPASSDNRPRTVALLQYVGIGDLVWHIQYFKLLAESSQGGRITILAQPSTLTRAFIGNEPWVEAVIDHDHRPRRGEGRRGAHAGLTGMWRLARQLRESHFDRIVLFSGRTSRGLIAWLSGIPVRMGFGYRPLQRIFLSKGPYIKPYKGDAVAAFPETTAFMIAHGFCDAPVVPRIEPPADQIASMAQRLGHLPRPLHAFAVGTSEPHKQWGIDNYASLATRLIREGGSVLVLGGPSEIQLAQDLLNLVPLDARHGMAIITDAPVLGSAAALYVADLCVGNDTGMVNVAAAVGRPTYVIIGSRPRLSQDPTNMHNIQARRLSDIDVDRVHALLIKHRSPAHANL